MAYNKSSAYCSGCDDHIDSQDHVWCKTCLDRMDFKIKERDQRIGKLKEVIEDQNASVDKMECRPTIGEAAIYKMVLAERDAARADVVNLKQERDQLDRYNRDWVSQSNHQAACIGALEKAAKRLEIENKNLSSMLAKEMEAAAALKSKEQENARLREEVKELEGRVKQLASTAVKELEKEAGGKRIKDFDLRLLNREVGRLRGILKKFSAWNGTMIKNNVEGYGRNELEYLAREHDAIVDALKEAGDV